LLGAAPARWLTLSSYAAAAKLLGDCIVSISFRLHLQGFAAKVGQCLYAADAT